MLRWSNTVEKFYFPHKKPEPLGKISLHATVSFIVVVCESYLIACHWRTVSNFAHYRSRQQESKKLWTKLGIMDIPNDAILNFQ